MCMKNTVESATSSYYRLGYLSRRQGLKLMVDCSLSYTRHPSLSCLPPSLLYPSLLVPSAIPFAHSLFFSLHYHNIENELSILLYIPICIQCSSLDMFYPYFLLQYHVKTTHLCIKHHWNEDIHYSITCYTKSVWYIFDNTCHKVFIIPSVYSIFVESEWLLIVHI